MNRTLLALFVVALSGPAIARAQTLAFPGAEGFGRFAKGARTNLSSSSVYHVTNLNESGAGSFRDAVSQPNRFVVFDVGGIVRVDPNSSPIVVQDNVTIAGQTAPGGIVIYGNKVSFSGANNTITRYLGVHKGEAGFRDDASGAANGVNMMFDHVSITWGVDETFSLNWDGKGSGLDNITIQDSIIAQGQDRLGHSAGGLMTLPEGSKFSVIRSIFADNVTRNPKVRGENEFINNVVYGWDNAAYIMGDTNGMESHANAIGNYFIESTVDGSDPFRLGSSHFHIYGADNWIDANRNGLLDGVPITSYPGADVVASPFAFPTTAMSAQDALGYVLENAGLSIVRDAVDARIVQEVQSYGTLGGIIQRETDLFPNYATNPQYVNPRARFADADNDGIADNWEAAHGLNSSNANDWKTLTTSGFTRLEEYVNELGAPGQTLLSNGGAWASPSTWGGASPTLADTVNVNGVVNQSSGNAFARRLNVAGTLAVTGGKIDVFDTLTMDGSAAIGSSAVTAGRVLIASPGHSASITLEAGGSLRTGTIAGNGGSASLIFRGGAVRAAAALDITVPSTIEGGGAEVDTAGFSGRISGAVTGGGGLTKLGEGELKLTGINSYSGPTTIDGGSLRITSANSLGNSSRIDVKSGAVLNVGDVPGGYAAAGGTTITGAGSITGNLTTAAGSILRPAGLPASNGAIVLTPDADTTVRYGIDQGSNFGAIGELTTRQNDTAPRDYMAYIRFDLSSIATPITDASFAATRSSGDSLVGGRVRVLGLNAVAGNTDQGWGETELTWNALGAEINTSIYPDPAVGASPLNLSRVTDMEQGVAGITESILGGSVVNITGSTLVNFLEARRQAGGQATLILDFPAVTSDKSIGYASKEHGALNAPTLTLSIVPETFLSIAGSFTQSAGSTLDIQIGGQDFDNTLVVTSTANLSGGLAVSLTNGFTPEASDEFVILDAGTLVGQFQGALPGARISTADGAGSFVVNYDYVNDVVSLTDFLLIGLPGDYNGDGAVDAGDYTVWRDHLGGDAAAQFAQGSRGNGVAGPIGQADYNTWVANFGSSRAPNGWASASASIPEPSTICLGTLLTLACGRGFRRSKVRGTSDAR